MGTRKMFYRLPQRTVHPLLGLTFEKEFVEMRPSVIGIDSRNGNVFFGSWVGIVHCNAKFCRISEIRFATDSQEEGSAGELVQLHR